MILIIVLTFVACNSQKRIIESEKKGYRIFFQKSEIKFTNLHISKKKIESIKKNRGNKAIKIYPKSTVKMITADSLSRELDFLGKKNFELIIINGIPYEKSYFKNALIDVNSIKQATILKQENANKLFDRRFKDDILIITTNK